MKAKRLLSMILSLVMLASVFVLGTTAAEVSPYKDVNTSRWSYADIMYVTEKGLMNGTTADKFAPAETMTRAMVVTVLYRLQGEPETQYKSTFTDVKNNKWFTDAVIWAAENKIVEGKGNGIFAPTETITREQLATIIMRYAPMEYIITEERADITHYADYKRVHDYAKDALSWANAIGLITGKTADTLAPREGATREQFAKNLRCFKEYDSYKYELVYNTPKPLSTYTEPDYPLVTDADIYVAVDGNDTNPGTLDKPVKTFAKAKEMVRELKKTAKDEIVVAFKAGDYGVLDNLQFTAEDSGTDDYPVTYCAYGDGEVYFTGGATVSENLFKALDDADKAKFGAEAAESIMKADLSGFDGADRFTSSSILFNNEGFCTLARYPDMRGNDARYLSGPIVQQMPLPGHTHEELMEIATTSGDQNLLKTVTDQKRITALNFFKKRLDTYTSFEGVQICGNISKIWHADNLDVESYDKTTGIITFKQSPQYGFVNYDENQASVYIAGSPTDLDHDGEYWFDETTKTLYVYKPAGEYMMAYQDSFITMERTDHIVFRNLNFRGSTKSLLVMKYCNDFTFDIGTLMYNGGTYGLDIDECLNVKITNSELAFFADEGIHVESPTSEYAIEGYHPHALISDGLVIDNNSIHDIGLITVGVDTSGIRLSNCVMSKITHNEIYNSNRCAIRFDNCIRADIAYNYFHHCMLNSADGGVVYGFRAFNYRDSNIRYNLFTDIPNKTGAQYAIYNDGSHAWNIIGNIFYDAGSVNVMLNGGRDNYVCDNICIESKNGKTSFLGYNSDPTEIDENGKPQINSNTEQIDAMYRALNERLSKDSPYYDLWYAEWPLLFDFSLDINDAGNYDCIFHTINYIKNNHLVGMTASYEENSIAAVFGDFENNIEYPKDENPIFVNPALGDYSIREGVDLQDNHFSEIGRY